MKLALTTVVVAVAIVGTMPSEAAKAKPKPIKGSYSVTLLPDPSPNATNEAGKPGCGVLPQSQDKHPFTVPAAGKLTVVLDSPDPSGRGLTDWDLYLLTADGIDASSHGGTSHEELEDVFKAKTPVTIWVCNLAGQPTGNISYTFTYK